MKFNPLFLIPSLMVSIAITLVACSDDGTTATPPVVNSPLALPSASVTGGITLLTAAGTTAALDFGITNTSTRNRDGGYLYTIASLAVQLTQGQPTTPAEFSAYLTKYGTQNDAQYSAIASTVTSLYSSYVYPKVAGSANGPAINAYLLAFAQGLQNAAAVYAPTTVIPAATTFYHATPSLRPIFGWKNAFDLSLARN